MRRPWIKIETATTDKPEICSIATQLRIDTDSVVGKLVRFWSWLAINQVESDNLGVTKEFLDKLVSRKGFADALIAAQWLVEGGGKLSIPHFERHNSDAAKVRALTAQRVKRHRILKAPQGKSNEVNVMKDSNEDTFSQEAINEPSAALETSDHSLDQIVHDTHSDNSSSASPSDTDEEPPPQSDSIHEVTPTELAQILSINAEPTFKPLDFESPPHDTSSNLPEIKVTLPPEEQASAAPEAPPSNESARPRKGKRKTEGTDVSQPLLW